MEGKRRRGRPTLYPSGTVARGLKLPNDLFDRCAKALSERNYPQLGTNFNQMAIASLDKMLKELGL